MEENNKKTIICSVLFLDIVEYSKKNVLGQISLKEGFNAFLLTAINTVPTDDRIILDTGDGAVISFLGDVGDALKVALSMRTSLLDQGLRMDPPLLVRMGINLGPVRLVRDINGLPNIVGDGINVAQRVMGFADPGQILVSRSYFEAVSRLSKNYAALFHYQGSRTDKHVREHDVYAIGYADDIALPSIAAAQAGLWEKIQFHVAHTYQTLTRKLATWELLAVTAYRHASPQQRITYMGILAVTLGFVLAMLIMFVASIAQPPSPNATVVAQQVSPPASAVAATNATAHKKNVQPKKPKTENKSLARTRSLEETTAINSGAPATITLSVAPWGEVYLNGRMQGISPPLAELQVVPGKHEVEIRNTAFPAYKKIFLFKPGSALKIRHKFGD